MRIPNSFKTEKEFQTPTSRKRRSVVRALQKRWQTLAETAARVSKVRFACYIGDTRMELRLGDILLAWADIIHTHDSVCVKADTEKLVNAAKLYRDCQFIKAIQ